MIDTTSSDGTPGASSRLATLSRRELEVVQMAAEGLTNTQIARRLDVTVHAVKFHLASIYRKLGVGNRTEAAVTYLRQTSA
jgi:DNA-binding CsgD family transcriptional regulator